MNMLDPSPPASIGMVDGQDRLVSADQRLAALNERAGGRIDAPLAVPQLAAIARLSRRLGIAISRKVIAADEHIDLELWVRAQPEGDGVRLEVTGWRPRDDRSGDEPVAGRDEDLFRSDADWMWETDNALRITMLPDAAGARFGFDASSLLGQSLTKLFSLSDDTDGDFPIIGALASQTRFEGQQATLRGTGRKVVLAAIPRTDQAGRFAGFVGAATMVEDVEPAPASSAIEGDTAFPEAFGQRLDKALRVPLSRIVANADSIGSQSEGPLRRDYAEYASDIASAGRHLLGLVEDLVDLQAIERSDFQLPVEPIDMADVARRAAGLLSVRASEAQVRIDRPATNETLPATGDFRRALQVLVNLIGNAVRYSPANAMVWIRLEREGDAACVIVADQGKGIAEEDQSRIFEKFERLDPKESNGSGLGLYIARRLARAMGGDLTVDSAPGQGARFIFTLPAQD